MRTALTITAAAALTLIVAATASAGGPFKFSNRAKFEHAIPKLVPYFAKHRLTIRSIGCAKAGVGRVACAVVTTGPAGLQRWALTLTCSSDAGVDCRYAVDAWPRS